MKNLILVTHGEFADGIITSVELIMGEVKNAVVVNVTDKGTISEIEGEINEKVASFKNNYPTVIFTDIAGGSTTQAALKAVQNNKSLYLISGLNLGLLLEVMVLDLNGNKEDDMKKLRNAIEVSKDGIKLVNDVFEVNTDDDDL